MRPKCPCSDCDAKDREILCLHQFALRVGDRILAAHEVLSVLAEKRKKPALAEPAVGIDCDSEGRPYFPPLALGLVRPKNAQPLTSWSEPRTALAAAVRDV